MPDGIDLKQVINGLNTIMTKGDDTLIMADCLRALNTIAVALNSAGITVTTLGVSQEEE